MHDKKTINITLKIHEHSILDFQYWLEQNLELVKLQVLPDTEKLYENDQKFKNIVNHIKRLKRERDMYINLNNN